MVVSVGVAVVVGHFLHAVTLHRGVDLQGLIDPCSHPKRQVLAHLCFTGARRRFGRV